MEYIIIALIVILLFLCVGCEYMYGTPNTYQGYRIKGYIGKPLTQSIDDSGADLRILGTSFTSTDQGH